MNDGVQFGGVRALVVEDDPPNQIVASRLLARIGCQVGVAHSGAEALRMMAEGTFDIVFMDIHMPQMDGYTATAAIREREGGREEVKIVAMTADAMPGIREKCFAAGMDDYISKLIAVDSLLLVLRRWFS